MKKLIDIILLLSRQEIAFRGHKENINSLNKDYLIYLIMIN